MFGIRTDKSMSTFLLISVQQKQNNNFNYRKYSKKEINQITIKFEIANNKGWWI